MHRLETLGIAAALLITDRLAESQAQYELEGNDRLAIVTVGHVQSISIALLAKILALSHSAAVRLVDRLSEKGYVRRNDGADTRSLSLSLSAKGRQLHTAMLAAQNSAIADTMSCLSKSERVNLEEILAKLLAANVRNEIDAYQRCRSCDESRCPARNCPVECGLAEGGAK